MAVSESPEGHTRIRVERHSNSSIVESAPITLKFFVILVKHRVTLQIQPEGLFLFEYRPRNQLINIDSKI